MKHAPSVLPLIGVIAAPEIGGGDVVRAVGDELFDGGAGLDALPWTYPDYRRAAAAGAFEPFRSHYLELLREVGK